MATWCVPRAVADGRAGRARHRRTGQFLEHRRLHSACGDVPPAEFEAAYHQRLQATIEAAWNPITRVSTEVRAVHSFEQFVLVVQNTNE